MILRFALRRLSDGLWRSARNSSQFGPWEGAQLWENPKKAKDEAFHFARHKKHLGWDNSVSPPFFLGYEDDPWPCEVVPLQVPEPK